MKKLIILVAVTVVMLGAIITGAIIFNSPSVVVGRATKNTISDIFERNEIKPLIKTITGGSIDFSLDKIVDNTGRDFFKNSSVSGKLNFSKKAIMLSNLNIKTGKDAISGEAYISEKEIYIKERNLLDGAYGFKIDTLAEELENSIFAPDSNSDFALEEEVYERIINALDNLEDNKKIKKDTEKLLKTVIKDFYNIIFENADVSSETTRVRINGERKRVRLITISIDEDSMEEIIMGTYNYLCESDDIIEYIEKYNDTLIPLADEIYDEDQHNNLAEAYKEWLNDIEEDVEDMCDDLDGFETIEIEFATKKGSAKLLRLDVNIDNDNIFTLDLGKKGIKKTQEITVKVDGVKIKYSAKGNRNDLNASISIKEGDYKFNILFAVDKESEKYSINISEEYENSSYYYDDEYVYTESYTITGKYAKKLSKTTLTIDKIVSKTKRDYESGKTEENSNTIKIDSVLVIDTNDKMPSRLKEYNTLSDLNEKRVDDFINECDDIIDEIFN